MAVRLGSSSGGLPPNPAPWNFLWRNERKLQENEKYNSINVNKFS